MPRTPCSVAIYIKKKLPEGRAKPPLNHQLCSIFARTIMPSAETTAHTDTPTGKRLDLVRGLGAWASAAIVIGTMIGTGIFLKPAEMAREGRFVSVVFAAWIVGAILSLFGALSYAELGAMIPEAGGEYAYLRRGFGPVWGFLFGWMHSIVGRPSSTSSIAAGLVRFLGFLLPAVGAPIFTAHIAIPGLTGWLRPYDLFSPGRSLWPFFGSPS